jgi:hypothetical protein
MEPITGFKKFRRCKILIVGLEDGRKEMDRRIQAVLIHHHIERQEIKGHLFCWSPKGMKLAEMKGGSRQIGELERRLRGKIQRLAAGDADNARGASATRDAGRLGYTLTTMADEEAETFGIGPEQRRLYVRLDKAKVNIEPPAEKATWFKLVGVRLGNGNEMYPNGDEVQTVEPWMPPETWTDLSTSTLNAVLTAIDAGLPNGHRYSDANAARDRAAWPVVQRHCPHKTEPQCREIIRTWVKNGVLYRDDYEDPVKHETCKGLRLDTSKRPG